MLLESIEPPKKVHAYIPAANFARLSQHATLPSNQKITERKHSIASHKRPRAERKCWLAEEVFCAVQNFVMAFQNQLKIAEQQIQ
jgi:hypothetical protein